MAFTKVVGPGIHTLSNILSHNINSSGIITATKFVGPFDNAIIGGGTTISSDGINVTGIVTATGLDVNGNGDISGNLVIGGNLTANGDFTTLNTTLREVELLRVDAQDDNVAAGIITQRGSGNILDLYDTSTNVLSVKDGGDLDIAQYIRHLGSTSETFGFPATGNRILATTNGSTRLTLDGDGRILVGITTATFLSQGGSDLLIEKAVGAGGTVSIDLYSKNATGNAFLRFYNGSQSGKIGIVGIGHSMIFCIQGVNSERMRLTSTGLGVGTTIPSRKLDVGGNGRFNKTGNCNVLVGSTNAGGAAIVLDGDSDGNGSGADYAYIEHDTSGNLNIVATNPADSSQMIFNTGDGSEALRITSSGEVRIPAGSNSTSRLTFGGGVDIYHDNNFKIENSTGYLKLQSNNNLYIDGDQIYLRNEGGTNRWIIDSSGHFIPGAAGTYDIGSTTAEIGDVYLADDKRLFFGSDQDFSIKHSGTNAFIDNDTGNLNIQSDTTYISNKSGGSIFAEFTDGGASKLRYAGGVKLATSGIGITVTGEVAASQEYPDIQPTFDANFAASRTLDPRFTFQRVGPASFVNEFGKVVLVGENVPRFDHDLTTRESLGILIEEERTNLATAGTIIGDTGWYKQPSNGFNLRDSTAPDGTTTATRITSLNTQSDPDLYSYLQYSIGSNKTITHTIYIKSPDTANVGKEIHFRGKRIGGTSSSWGQKFILTAEWQRVTITHTYQSDNSTGRAYIGSDPNTSHSAGAATACLFWGLQVETGSFATSFIPTYGATVTRGADLLRIMDDEFKDIFGDEFKEFSIVADYDNSDTVDGSIQALVDFWGESAGYTDRIEIFKDGDSPYNIEVRGIANNAGLFANGVANASSKALTQRFATSWSVDYTTNNAANRRWAFSFSGEAVDVIGDAVGTDVPALTRLGLGNTPTRLDLSPGKLHFKRFTFYPKAVSDQQLINLSTP